MVEIGGRQLLGLFLSVTMIAAGALGLSGHIEPTPTMGAVLLVVAIVLTANLADYLSRWGSQMLYFGSFQISDHE